MIIIKSFDHILTVIDDPKKPKIVRKLQGYKFLNKEGLCMLICYGETRRDEMIEKLKKNYKIEISF